MTLICTIRSSIMGRSMEDTSTVIEPGLYELPVHVRMSEAAASGDPKGFVQKEISRHLAGCIQDTGIPLGEKMWHVEFTNFAQANFNFPKGFTA